MEYDYSLAKDLPDVKAGAVFEFNENENEYVYNYKDGHYFFNRNQVENNPEWFTPITKSVDPDDNEKLFTRKDMVRFGDFCVHDGVVTDEVKLDYWIKNVRDEKSE